MCLTVLTARCSFVCCTMQRSSLIVLLRMCLLSFDSPVKLVHRKCLCLVFGVTC